MKFNLWEDCDKVPLTELLSFVVDNRGKTVPTVPSGHKLIATNCVTNNTLFPVYEKIRYLSEETYQTWFRAHPIPGDILFVNKGTPGRVCLVPDPVDFCIAQDMIALRADESKIYPKYLFAVLRSREIQQQIYNTNVGDVIPHFKKQFLDQLMIPIPERSIQESIGNLYYVLSLKAERNKMINDNLEEQSKVIFDKLFPNISNGSYTVGNYITPKRGKNLLSKNAVQGNVPVVAGGLVPSVYHNTSNTKAPVLAISASGANAGYVSLWNIPIWASDSSYIDSSMTNNVYFWYVLLKKRQKEIFDAQTGSAQPHIYPQHIAGMPIKELEVAKIQEFNAMVTPIFEKIGKNLKENTQLETLRDILLPKLMSGEIDISAVQF